VIANKSPQRSKGRGFRKACKVIPQPFGLGNCQSKVLKYPRPVRLRAIVMTITGLFSAASRSVLARAVLRISMKWAWSGICVSPSWIGVADA
jgi:hypothetical protein